MQSVRSQSQGHISGDHLHKIFRIGKSSEQKRDAYLPKAGGGDGAWEVMAKADRVSLGGHQ